MAQTIQWSMTAQVPNGPRIVTSQVIEIEAYDSIKLNVGGNVSDMEVELQPGAAGRVKVLIITSDQYSDNLSYKANAVGNPEIIIDQPQALMGEGAVGLLDPAPTSLFFTNTAPADETAAIEILVGRDATDPSP